MFECTPTNVALTPFPQTMAYAAAMARLGARARRVDINGSVLMLQRPGLRLISRLPVTDARLQRLALRCLARFAGALIVTPEDDLRGFRLIPLVTSAHHAVWDLAGDMRRGMDAKWRNRLVAAERAGLRATPGLAGALQRLAAAEAGQRSAKGYASLPPAFSLALPDHSLRLWEWRQGGAVRAAMAFVVEGGTATYHLGHADRVARAASAHNVMLWQAACALRSEGVRWLDLGSVSDAAPGLMRFKLGTGAALHRLGHTLLVLPG